MKRTSTIVLLGLLTFTGCRNMGLDDAGPADEAAIGQPSDLVASVHQRAAEPVSHGLIVDGRRWATAGRPGSQMLDEDNLRPIGSTGGQTVYANRWDDAPYDVLYTAGEDGEWQTYLSVIGGDGHGAAEGDAASDRDAASDGDAAGEAAAPGH